MHNWNEEMMLSAVQNRVWLPGFHNTHGTVEMWAEFFVVSMCADEWDILTCSWTMSWRKQVLCCLCHCSWCHFFLLHPAMMSIQGTGLLSNCWHLQSMRCQKWNSNNQKMHSTLFLFNNSCVIALIDCAFSPFTAMLQQENEEQSFNREMNYKHHKNWHQQWI